MAYIYLFNLYDKIEQELARIDQQVQKAGQDPVQAEYKTGYQARYQEGRADILRDFKAYLQKNLNHKLPGRMRRKLSEKDH